MAREFFHSLRCRPVDLLVVDILATSSAKLALVGDIVIDSYRCLSSVSLGWLVRVGLDLLCVLLLLFGVEYFHLVLQDLLQV